MVPWRSIWSRGLSTSKKDLVRLAQPFLEPGEEVRHVVIAYQSVLEPHWAIVVTDRAIVLLEPGVIRPGFSRWVRGQRARRLPRHTRLGPIYGRGWILVDGERFFVPQRRQVAAVDAEVGFGPE